MLALTFALSACESEPAENVNANKPSAATPPASSPSQEVSPAASSDLRTGDKVKVTANGVTAQATIVSVDEKAGKVTVRVNGEKQDKTVAIADVVKQ